MYVVSQMAKARIVRANRPSAPGTSPHSKGKPGKNLKGSIRYFLDKDVPEAIIGPSTEFIDDVGELHEKAATDDRRRNSKTIQSGHLCNRHSMNR